MAIPWAAFLAATRGLDFLKILTVGALPTRWQHQVPEIALVLWLAFYVASAVVARLALLPRPGNQMVRCLCACLLRWGIGCGWALQTCLTGGQEQLPANSQPGGAYGCCHSVQ